MTNPLYLTPPTVGELFWVAATGTQSPEEALAELKLLMGPSAIPNTLRQPFVMNEIKRVEEQELDELMKRLVYVKLDLKINGVSSVEQLIEIRSQVSPEATLRRGGGDCKSFAILYVALQRARGRAARFSTYNGNHMITELDVEGSCGSRMWLRHDPQQILLRGPLANFDEAYSENYEAALALLNQ